MKKLLLGIIAVIMFVAISCATVESTNEGKADSTRVDTTKVTKVDSAKVTVDSSKAGIKRME